MDSTAALLHVTAGRERELRAALAPLPPALDSAGGALADVDAAVPPLRALVRETRPSLPQLAPTARALLTLLRAARPALSQADAFVHAAPGDLRTIVPLLREARPVLADLGPVLTKAGPMLDEARVRLPDAFSFFANWADFTGNYDANGHAARVGIVLPPAPTNVLAPDSNGPGQLALPYLRTPGALESEPWRDYRKSFAAGGKR